MQGNSESLRSSANQHETISEPICIDGLYGATIAEGLTNRKRRRRRKKKNKINQQQQIFIGALRQVIVGTGSQQSDLTESKSEFRKLSRRFRYFNLPRESGFSCRNCGELGHREANCTEPKRKRPCFVCGTLEHDSKRCKLRRKCLICKEKGHLVKHCPVSNNGDNPSSNVCLRCGIDSKHDMFSCFSDYCSDDIKEIQCYICKSYGHLCCADPISEFPVSVSCFSCGQSGHLGLECLKVHDDIRNISSQLCGSGEAEEVKLHENSRIM